MRYGTQRILPRYSGGVRKWDYGRAVKPRAVFVHIMEGNLSGTDGWFRNPASGTVSTHFGIGYANIVARFARRVSVYQWVDTANTAWGTAVTRYPVSWLAHNVLGDLIRGGIDVNHGIIHIEVEGYPHRQWPSGFVSALNALLAALGRAHGPLMVMRHNDVSRKVCPGFATPWAIISPSYGRRLTSTPVPAPQPLPDTALPKETDLAILEKLEIPGDTGRLFDVRAGIVLRKGPGITYGQHFKTTGPVRYRLLGFSPGGWVAASNPNSPTGIFFVPPVH